MIRYVSPIMIRYVLWTVLFGVDIFEFLRIWFGCIYNCVYIYIYIYIYTRDFVSHTLSLECTHTHTRRGGWVKGQRDRGIVGHRGGGAEGMGGGGAEGLGHACVCEYVLEPCAWCRHM